MSTDGAAEDDGVDLPLPFAPDSDTSRAAARQARTRAVTDSAAIFAYIQSQGERGATCDEVTVATGIVTQTAVARINGLTRARWIRDSGLRRRTRQRGWAVVHIARAVEDRLEAVPPLPRERRDGFYYLYRDLAGVLHTLGPWLTAAERNAQMPTVEAGLLLAVDVDRYGTMTCNDIRSQTQPHRRVTDDPEGDQAVGAG
jgi:hypothetical protein